MANIRTLKKEINYVAYELLDEALSYKAFHPEMEEEKFNTMLEDIVSRRNELIAGVNETRKLDSGETKAKLNEIRKKIMEMITVFDEIDFHK